MAAMLEGSSPAPPAPVPSSSSAGAAGARSHNSNNPALSRLPSDVNPFDASPDPTGPSPISARAGARDARAAGPSGGATAAARDDSDSFDFRGDGDMIGGADALVNEDDLGGSNSGGGGGGGGPSSSSSSYTEARDEHGFRINVQRGASDEGDSGDGGGREFMDSDGFRRQYQPADYGDTSQPATASDPMLPGGRKGGKGKAGRRGRWGRSGRGGRGSGEDGAAAPEGCCSPPQLKRQAILLTIPFVALWVVFIVDMVNHEGACVCQC